MINQSMQSMGVFGALVPADYSSFQHHTNPAAGFGRILKSPRRAGSPASPRDDACPSAPFGMDVVAMCLCVNDVSPHGAEPLFFDEDFAFDPLDVESALRVLADFGESSKIGGDRGRPAPARASVSRKVAAVRAGDVLVALPSSGLHRADFARASAILEASGLDFTDLAPFSTAGKSLGEELLVPTRISMGCVLAALRTGRVKALARVTRGGLAHTLPKLLPRGLRVALDAASWAAPPAFAWLAHAGGLSEHDMLGTFNCGVGLVLVVSPADAKEVVGLLVDEKASAIGQVEDLADGDDRRVLVRSNRLSIITPLSIGQRSTCANPRKRRYDAVEDERDSS